MIACDVSPVAMFLYCFCIVVVLCLNCIVIGSSANPLKRGSDVEV